MEKIVYIDGGLASQMGAYAFYYYLETLKLEPKMDLWWYRTEAGMEKYKLESIFGLKVQEYKAPLKYRIYRSKNNFARVLRKTGILKVITNMGLIPMQYYTLKPPYAGKMFDLSNIPKELLQLDCETYFWGYWQFWAPYIEKNLEELRKKFTFREFEEEKNISMLASIKKTNSVCLHIRRGDFLIYSDTFVNLSKNYYQNAVKYMQEKLENPVFYIFSNDIDWCRENIEEFNLCNDNVEFIDWNFGDSDYRDMQLMIECKHFIVANSGFSSWAAVLNNNQNKLVVAPKIHYTDFIKEKNLIRDPFCPQKWIKLDVD